MPDFLSLLHAPTMVLMVVVLYAALSLVLVYAYACRRTYPGFGAMTLGQVLWFVGIFLNFYRVLGETPSLFAGNALMLVEAVLVFHGLARYGQIGDIRLRSGLNVVLYGLAMVAITHYLFIDYNTCRRAAIYSAFCAIVFGRISLEPYLTRNWRTYATQGLFSGFFSWWPHCSPCGPFFPCRPWTVPRPLRTMWPSCCSWSPCSVRRFSSFPSWP